MESPQPEKSKPPVKVEQRGRILGIGGVFFKSANRNPMREWYSKHLGLTDKGQGAMLPWREHDDPHAVSRRPVAWHWEQYLAKPEDGENPLASPLRAETLAGLPAATVITAELDPLRDEAEQYALMLLASGVAVDVRRYNAVPHGFFAMPGIYHSGREAQAYAAACLAAAFKTEQAAA